MCRSMLGFIDTNAHVAAPHECLIVLRLNVPADNFSHVRTEPPLPGYSPVTCDSQCVLLQDTTRCTVCGLDPGPPDLESDALPPGYRFAQ